MYLLIDMCVFVYVWKFQSATLTQWPNTNPAVYLVLLKASPSLLDRLQHPLEIYSCCVKYFSDIVLFPF